MSYKLCYMSDGSINAIRPIDFNENTMAVMVSPISKYMTKRNRTLYGDITPSHKGTCIYTYPDNSHLILGPGDYIPPGFIYVSKDLRLTPYYAGKKFINLDWAPINHLFINPTFELLNNSQSRLLTGIYRNSVSINLGSMILPGWNVTKRRNTANTEDRIPDSRLDRINTGLHHRCPHSVLALTQTIPAHVLGDRTNLSIKIPNSPVIMFDDTVIRPDSDGVFSYNFTPGRSVTVSITVLPEDMLQGIEIL